MSFVTGRPRVSRHRSGTSLLFSLSSIVESSIFESAASDLVVYIEDASYVSYELYSVVA